MNPLTNDVVFILMRTSLDGGAVSAKVVMLRVLKRDRKGVYVERTWATHHRSRLMNGMYFEYPEDAVRAYSLEVRELERKATQAKADLESMRDELMNGSFRHG